MTASLSLPGYFQLSVGLGGYTESSFVSDPGDPHRTRFDSYADRLDRYRVFWSHYEGNVYRKIHKFSEALKREHDLYPAIRTVYSPVYRGVEFWAEHLMAGILDDEAGDGQERPSALPIKIGSGHPKEKELRAVIAELCRVSVWQVHKEIWTRFGAALGDVGLMVEDDPARQLVSLKVIHPGIVRDVDLDSRGNCKGYAFEEWRPDPREDDRLVTPRLVKYNEVATRVGRRVEYATYLDDKPFDWRDYPYEDSPRVGPAWTEGYGFVPFVWHQHRNMGLGAGWSEYHPSLGKLHELDDVASKVVDQIRKSVDAPWLFAGIADVEDLKNVGDSEGGDGAQSARNRSAIWTCPEPNVKAQPLVAPLDLAAASAEAQRILAGIERDHSELVDDENVSGSASGRARRVARERIEARVAARRAGYDNAWVRAVQMAISIGASKGYPGYEAFGTESFAEGLLDFSIGDRPVFAMDTMDDIEEGKAFWEMVGAAVTAGVPLEVVLRREGWSDEDINEILDAKEINDQQQLDQVNQRMQMAGGVGDTGGDGLGVPENLFQLNGTGGG